MTDRKLQPVVSGGLCENMVVSLPQITLDTVYRTSDEQQLLVLSRIRERQPTRQAPATTTKKQDASRGTRLHLADNMVFKSSRLKFTYWMSS